jgi:hypothetical protein
MYLSIAAPYIEVEVNLHRCSFIAKLSMSRLRLVLVPSIHCLSTNLLVLSCPLYLVELKCSIIKSKYKSKSQISYNYDSHLNKDA